MYAGGSRLKECAAVDTSGRTYVFARTRTYVRVYVRVLRRESPTSGRGGRLPTRWAGGEEGGLVCVGGGGGGNSFLAFGGHS